MRFTPAVYKFLLGGEECTLSDLKAEDPTLLEYDQTKLCLLLVVTLSGSVGLTYEKE